MTDDGEAKCHCAHVVLMIVRVTRHAREGKTIAMYKHFLHIFVSFSNYCLFFLRWNSREVKIGSILSKQKVDLLILAYSCEFYFIVS